MRVCLDTFYSATLVAIVKSSVLMLTDNSDVLSPVQPDATLLAKSSQNCWMLHVASVCTPCCMLLHIVGSCCPKFEIGQIVEATTLDITFVPWFQSRELTWRNIVGSVWTALPTLLGPRTRITRGLHNSYFLYPSHDALQVPTLLGAVAPFAHHCQHGRNNSQHCWPNSVGGCYARLHVALSLF